MIKNVYEELIDLLMNENMNDEFLVGTKIAEYLKTGPVDHHQIAHILQLLEGKFPNLYHILHDDFCTYVAQMLLAEEYNKKSWPEYTN